ncbi:MAG: hypothetical protein HQM10_10655 [Candidatus Riflebacteria bacterium]|nr:hypothetical protein [Candidatus Riflebacteria bacterium]
MSVFDLEVKASEGVVVVFAKGYCSADASGKLNGLLETLAKVNNLKLVMDFSDCRLINSPGVVVLVDFTMRVVDDFRGKFIITGVSELQKSVFQMAGIFPLAGLADSLKNAIQNALAG